MDYNTVTEPESSAWMPPLCTGWVRRGPQSGWRAIIQPDPSNTGWHIFLLQPTAQVGDGRQGYDIWADSREDLLNWLGPSELDVELDGDTHQDFL